MLNIYRQSMHDLGLRTLKLLEVPDANEQKIIEEYRKEALKNIATLFSELEWLHPWIDGQGRSDIVLCNFLLAQEGLNPAILDNPYYSSFNTIPDWATYLKQGIAQWKNEYQKINAAG